MLLNGVEAAIIASDASMVRTDLPAAANAKVQTARHRHVIYQQGAGAARALIAGDLGAGQAEPLALITIIRNVVRCSGSRYGEGRWCSCRQPAMQASMSERTPQHDGADAPC